MARPAGPEELVLLEAEAALRAGAAKHKPILNSMIEAIFNNLSIVFFAFGFERRSSSSVSETLK